MHSLLRMHHASMRHAMGMGNAKCVRSASEMRNLYHSPIHAMHATYSAACEMRMADGNNILYMMMNIGRTECGGAMCV